MAVLPILRYPDPRLRQIARPVTAFDADLRRLATDLLDTMRAAEGIGITAPHVGVALRIVVLQLAPDEPSRTYVNPELAWASPETVRHREGSVSMPGVAEELDRPARVQVRYQDIDGTAREESAEGLRAVCHQHEIDQLAGIFWLQRLSRLKRERVVKQYDRLRRGA